MQTKWITIEESDNAAHALLEAGARIKKGGIVAFPTETVYGLGGDALNPASSAKIYEAKGRPSDNPLIVHIADWKDLEKIVLEIPDTARKLANAFWPGPLTMILKKSKIVPKETTGGLETVAVRMPNHPIALQFIKASGGYIAAPSANISGKPSPTLAKYVYEDMNGKIDMIIDGGLVGIGLESTIVDLTSQEPMILRPGFVTKEMLETVLGNVETDATILEGTMNQAPKAPGMKYKHYAPAGKLVIINGEENQVIKKINEALAKHHQNGEKTGVIATQDTCMRYTGDSIKNLGKKTDEAAIARHLYQVLREFDEEKVEFIYSEAFSEEGMGQAIMNRLLKAAGYNVENA